MSGRRADLGRGLEGLAAAEEEGGALGGPPHCLVQQQHQQQEALEHQPAQLHLRSRTSHSQPSAAASNY